MSASLSGVWNLQEFTNLGTLAAGYRLYTYVPSTTTLKTAYTDAAGAVPHTYTSDGAGGQYIALNARGELPAPLFLTSGGYDLTLKDASGATIWTRRANGQGDDASTLTANLGTQNDSSKGAGQVGLHLTGTNETDTYVGPFLNLKVKGYKANFAAAIDGVTNDYNAYANAVTAVGKIIEFEGGTSIINSASLPVPTCAEMRGWGPDRSILQCGATVAGQAIDATGFLRMRDFKLRGAGIAGVGGIYHGKSAVWYGESHNVRVENFTGAGSFGMRLGDAQKGVIWHPYLDGNYDNFRVDRTSPAFPTSTDVLHMISVNAANLGLDVVDSDVITFLEPVLDSNAKGAIRVIARAGGTITGLFLIRPRMEDNAATQTPILTDGVNSYRYQFVAGDSTALGGATIRFVLDHPTLAPGGAGARSIILNGSAVAGAQIIAPDVPNSQQIALINNAYGRIDEWLPNLGYSTCVYDPLYLDFGPWGPMRDYAPGNNFSTSIGNYGASFSGSPGITEFRYKQDGKSFRQQWDLTLQLLAINPAWIKIPLPPGIAWKNNNTVGSLQLLDGAVGKPAICLGQSSDNTILCRPADLSNLTSGNLITLRGSIAGEVA